MGRSDLNLLSRNESFNFFLSNSTINLTILRTSLTYTLAHILHSRSIRCLRKFIFCLRACKRRKSVHLFWKSIHICMKNASLITKGEMCLDLGQFTDETLEITQLCCFYSLPKLAKYFSNYIHLMSARDMNGCRLSSSTIHYAAYYKLAAQLDHQV